MNVYTVSDEYHEDIAYIVCETDGQAVKTYLLHCKKIYTNNDTFNNGKPDETFWSTSFVYNFSDEFRLSGDYIGTFIVNHFYAPLYDYKQLSRYCSKEAWPFSYDHYNLFFKREFKEREVL